MRWGKHLMLELVEASFRSLALGVNQDLDPGLRDLALDLLATVVMDTGTLNLRVSQCCIGRDQRSLEILCFLSFCHGRGLSPEHVTLCLNNNSY